MKYIRPILLILLFLSIVPVVIVVRAQECTPDNINKVSSTTDTVFLSALMAKCDQSITDMQNAVKPHVDELNKMKAAIVAFQARIVQIEADVTKKSAEIAEGENNLAGSLVLANERIRQFYMRSYISNPMYLFLSSSNIGSVLRTLGYQQAAINEDKMVIMQTAVTVKDLEDKKTALEAEKASLAALKADTDKRAAAVQALVDQATAYESQLQGYIAQISARQQEFLNQKLAGLGIPLFAISGGGCSSDLTNGKDPGFSGGFGLFTYGVPNRVGLNQYGAWGRAQAGQDAETILRAYYNFDSISTVNTGTTIHVQGYGDYSLEDYMNRVYEVPDSWTDNNLAALKAQAIAVRSYVMAYTNNGAGSICTTQQCQVFQPNPKGGNWAQAVSQTAGQVMMQGGSPIKAYFSSTHGGYVFATGDLSGWSATSYTKRAVDANGSIASFSDLNSKAYDRSSPWFYCDWGGRSQYNGTAWLTPSEMADIVNVILLAQADSSTQAHLVQTDKPNPDYPNDPSQTWSPDRVRSELSSRGVGPFNSVSSMSVSADFGVGRTTSVVISGDAGTRTFDGDTFKTYFNLRAPANIQIVGPLYNVERH